MVDGAGGPQPEGADAAGELAGRGVRRDHRRDEVAAGEATLRNLATHDETRVAVADVAAAVRAGI